MHPEGLYAGTADLICYLTIDDIEFLALVDIKSTQSGFYEDNEIQLKAYKDLWDIEFPGNSIARVYNYGCHNYRLPLSSRVQPYKFKDQTDSQVAYKWDLWIREFHGDPRNKIEKIKYDFKENISLNINNYCEDIFEEVDIIGRVQKAAEF
jgi:hypothetical protein